MSEEPGKRHPGPNNPLRARVRHPSPSLLSPAGLRLAAGLWAERDAPQPRAPTPPMDEGAVTSDDVPPSPASSPPAGPSPRSPPGGPAGPAAPSPRGPPPPPPAAPPPAAPSPAPAPGGLTAAPPGVTIAELQELLDAEGAAGVDLGGQVVRGARALRLRRPGLVLRNGALVNKGSQVRSLLSDGKTAHRVCSVLLSADGCRLEGVKVTGCAGDSQLMGDSVLVYRASDCVLRECHVAANGWCGVMVRGEGAVGIIEGGSISHNGGSGVGCDNGGELRVDGAVIERNGYNAVESHGRGCLAVVTDSVCSANKHAGLAAINAAVIEGRRLLLSHNATGCRARARGSVVHLRDCTCEGGSKAGVHALEEAVAILSERVTYATGPGTPVLESSGGQVLGHCRRLVSARGEAAASPSPAGRRGEGAAPPARGPRAPTARPPPAPSPAARGRRAHAAPPVEPAGGPWAVQGGDRGRGRGRVAPVPGGARPRGGGGRPAGPRRVGVQRGGGAGVARQRDGRGRGLRAPRGRGVGPGGGGGARAVCGGLSPARSLQAPLNTRPAPGSTPAAPPP